MCEMGSTNPQFLSKFISIKIFESVVRKVLVQNCQGSGVFLDGQHGSGSRTQRSTLTQLLAHCYWILSIMTIAKLMISARPEYYFTSLKRLAL
jgi:hypothetical protein